MSKYVIIHGQMCEIPDDTLMHWKYIKREKVGDKWKYYYDLGEKEKQNYEKAKKAYDSRKAQIESASRQKKPIADKESNWGDSLTRYWRVDSSGDKRGSYDKDGRYRKQNRAIDTLKNEMNEAERAYRKTPLGRREARAEKAKEVTTKAKTWAKDKLGYDEKQNMESAKVAAKNARRDAQDTHKRDEEWKAKNPGNENIKEMADWQIAYKYELAAEAWGKAKEATEKYNKTPLAKLEKMQNTIESAKKWLNGDRAVEERRELSDAKFAYNNAKGIERYYRDKYEEVKSKVESGEYFDKDRGNEALLNDWKEPLEKAQQDSARAYERYTKAQDVYDNTPYAKRKKREKEKAAKRKKR